MQGHRELVPISAVTGREAAYTLDWLPVSSQDWHKGTNIHVHTYGQLTQTEATQTRGDHANAWHKVLGDSSITPAPLYSLQWCHFLLAKPSAVQLSIAIMCKMTSSTRSSVRETMKPDTQRHWQTLQSSAHTTWPPQTWACLAAGIRRHPSNVCQLSWNVPTEYTLQHHYQHPCPHLVYLGTFWVWWEKRPIANDKSSARQHIYTS